MGKDKNEKGSLSTEIEYAFRGLIKQICVRL